VGPIGPIGPIGPQGEIGPQGPAGVAGLEVIKATFSSVAQMVFTTELKAKTVCSTGKRVVSGGYSLTGALARSLTVLTSYPETGDPNVPEGWVVEFRNNTSTNLGVVNVSVYATCVNK
jgi:hypothetical protein